MNFLAVIFANLFTSDDPAKTGGGVGTSAIAASII